MIIEMKEDIPSNYCRLCQKNTGLELSHIIPKFIFKYQKKTSPTGFVRSVKSPNRIARDGEKLPFLCGNCEDMFSRWETKFASNIFHPYQSGEVQQFEYEDWLSKYLASVVFRVLMFVYEDSRLTYASPLILPYAQKVLSDLRRYLLGQVDTQPENKQRLLLLDKMVGTKPDILDFYLTRAIEFDVFTVDSEAFVYVKYLKFMQLYPIKIVNGRCWDEGIVSYQYGQLRSEKYGLPSIVRIKIDQELGRLVRSQNEISIKQRTIIENRLKQKDIGDGITSNKWFN